MSIYLQHLPQLPAAIHSNLQMSCGANLSTGLQLAKAGRVDRRLRGRSFDILFGIKMQIKFRIILFFVLRRIDGFKSKIKMLEKRGFPSSLFFHFTGRMHALYIFLKTIVSNSYRNLCMSTIFCSISIYFLNYRK